MALRASLHIATEQRCGKTVLKSSYATQPYKIANITEDTCRPDLHLMLMTSSPGILDGDHYQVQLEVGEGSALVIDTQSYQRIFQMQLGAVQEMEIVMKKGSSLTYLQHPLVPHRKAIFSARTKIFLGEGCRLLWGEVISCGRKQNGEVFQLTSYHSLTEIFKNEKLAVKENILVRPADVNPQGMGQLEGFTHQATLLFLRDDCPVSRLPDDLRELLRADADLAVGVTALPVPGIMVRLMGNKAEHLFSLLKKIATYLQEHPKKTTNRKHAHEC